MHVIEGVHPRLSPILIQVQHHPIWSLAPGNDIKNIAHTFIHFNSVHCHKAEMSDRNWDVDRFRSPISKPEEI